MQQREDWRLIRLRPSEPVLQPLIADAEKTGIGERHCKNAVP
jgi:hypothetical protein